VSAKGATYLVAALAAAVVLAGCYGSTEPATDIGPDHATFHGRGTANQGPVHVYFEFWPTAHPTEVSTTLGEDVPDGASGPVSEPHFPFPLGLQAATEYAFRMCGKDRATPNGVCAQTLRFTTTRPEGDFVAGGFSTQIGGVGHSGGVGARNGAAGGNPSGELNLPGDFGNTFSGDVSCLIVRGHDAVVGAVGELVDGTPATGLLRVLDARSFNEPDLVAYTVTSGSTTPPSCATFTAQPRSTVFTVFSVYDAP
jgi:hypothetical protein